MSDHPAGKQIVVIADDEDLGRLLLAESAEAAGLTPLVYDNGADALAAALSQDVAMLLLDVEMPGLNGFEVCRRVRAQKRAALPIVMVTGLDDRRAIDQAFEAGATDFISKPVNWSLLPHRLTYILRNAEREANILRLAFYDPLTGLPNRQHCIDEVTQALVLAGKCAEGAALLYVDLNSFKRINDTFGHSIGDIVLQRVAAILRSVLASRASEESSSMPFLARLGGDEFVVLLRHVEPRPAAAELAQAICAALAMPIAYETLEFLATPSVGIAVYPNDGVNVETLLKHADTAMYQAKVSGGAKVVVYAPAMSARLRDSLELETRLRRALRQDALDIRFQPKFRVADGVLVGAEALLRWFDDDLGEISPNRFIPVAEESGLIVDIGAWILRAVCNQLRVWHAEGLAVPIAVNVSGKELLFADPSRIIKAETERAGIPSSLIEAEITESVFVTDLTAARSSVNRIRQLGCRIALDDFGTGYSSLSYLTRFPPDRLKIDRSFIANLDRSESDAAIVKAIISLAKTLNLLVTAEGIERPGQLQWLQAFGCDEAQGYLLAKPLTARELEARFLRAPLEDQSNDRVPTKTAGRA